MLTSYDSANNNTHVIPLWFTLLLTDIWSIHRWVNVTNCEACNITKKVVKECLDIKNKNLPYDVRVHSCNTTAPIHKYLPYNGRYFLQFFM